MGGKQKVKAGVSQLTNEDQTLTKNDQKVADVLNSFCKSVFIKEEGTGPLPDFPYVVEEEDCVYDIALSEEDVKKKLDQLKVDKAHRDLTICTQGC